MRGSRIVRWWADRYTRGLAGSLRADRTTELESDLWEQQAAYGDGLRTQLVIASRCLRGVPADLRWRKAHLRGSHLVPAGAVIRSLGWAVAGLGYAFLAVFHGVLALPLLGVEIQPNDWDEPGATIYAGLGAVVFVLLVSGALVFRSHPRTGATLVALGALAPIVAFWWGAAVYGPVGVTVATTAVLLGRRRRRAIRPNQECP